MLLDGRAQESGIKRRGSDATLLIVFNAHHDVVPFTLPEVAEGRHWVGLIDTAQPDAPPATYPFGHVYTRHRPLALRLRAGGRRNWRLVCRDMILGQETALRSISLVYDRRLKV